MVYSDEALDFINSLPQKAKDKVAYNISKCMVITDNELFKKLEGTEIWEFRTLYNNIKYRLLAFWDTEEETLVIATHGFIKKTQKTPAKEIAKAEAMRKEYFNDKKQIRGKDIYDLINIDDIWARFDDYLDLNSTDKFNFDEDDENDDLDDKDGLFDGDL